MLGTLIHVGPLNPGVSIVVNHGLEKAPNTAAPTSSTSIRVVGTPTATQITFRNDGSLAASANFRVRVDHSIISNGSDPLFWEGDAGIGTDASAATILATGSTTPRTAADRFGEVFNVKDYGAVGNGIHDDGPNISATMAAALPVAGVVWFPNGSYRVNTSIDGSRLNAFVFKADGITFRGDKGAAIYGYCAGKSVFDFTGAVGVRIERLQIQGNSGSIPQSAVLFARNSSNDSAGNHVIQDLIVRGSFTKAGVISISSEISKWDNLDVVVTAGDSAVSNTAQNDLSAVSDYQAFPGVFSGGNTVHTYTGGLLANNNTAAAALIARFTAIRGIAITGTFFSAVSGPTASIRFEDIEGMVLNSVAELASTTRGFEIHGRFNSNRVFGSWGNGVYGADSSSIEFCEFGGVYQGTPNAFNVYNMSDTHIRFGAPAGNIQIRNSNYGNMLNGMGLNGVTSQGQTIIAPVDSQGNIYADRAGRSDGQNLYRWDISNESPLGRTKTHYLHAALIKRINQVFATVVSGSLTIDPHLGSVINVALDHDVLVNYPISTINYFAPFTASDTWDDGTQITYVFTQDATGKRAVTWAANFKTFGWQPDPSPNSISSITFMLVFNNTLVRVGSSHTDLAVASGTATLVAGTKTVATTAVVASSRILVTMNTPGGTPGFLSVPVASIVAGTSFVINSTNGADTSTVNWWIISN